MSNIYNSPKQRPIAATRGMKYLLIVFACATWHESIYAQSWTDVGSPLFTMSLANFTSIALDAASEPYVAYLDGSTPNLGATVMKYNGSSWDTVGTRGFSGQVAYFTSMAIDGSGIPYVAYEDVSPDSLNGEATMMKYNGSSWVDVGSPRFSAGWISNMSMALNSSGTPYVVYQDLANGYKATVMEYNGSNWETVGSAGFSAGGATGNKWMAIDGSGTPYVAYSAYDTSTHYNSGPVTVMKYNGAAWEAVGSAGFSAGGIAYYTSIAIDGSGTPYVVYADSLNAYKATVMKYNGSSWVTVGSPGFSTGEALYTSIAINSSGTPYVVYEDGNYDKAVVMEYNGSSWVDAGSPGFSAAGVSFPSIAINGSGAVYVSYTDSANISGNPGKATVMELGATTGTTNVIGKTAGLTILPNPTHDNLTIQSTNEIINNISISNVLGQNLQSAVYSSQYSVMVDVSDLPSGVYFVKVSFGFAQDEVTAVRKFVKE